MTRSNVLSLALLALLSAGWFFLLRPAFLGGPASYVMVTGPSMEPTMHSGDLAMLRQQESYGEGDVIAFHADGGVVIHRVIGGSADSGYVLQGDNNSFVDGWRPYPQHVLGRMWLHVPYAGRPIQHLQEPWLLGLVLGGITGMSVLSGKRVINRQRRRRERERSRWTLSRVAHALRTVSAVSAVLALSVLLALVFTGAAVYGFTRPSTALAVERPVSIEQRGAIDYTVRMERSALYPAGTVDSQDIAGGEPPVLYRNLLRSLDLQFSYQLTGSEPLQARGQYSAQVVLAADRGWSKEIDLVAPTPFEGEAVDFSIPVDIRELFALIELIEEEISHRASSYTLTVMPLVEIEGQAHAEPLDERFEQAFSMTLSGARFSLDRDRVHVEGRELDSNEEAAEHKTEGALFASVSAAVPWAGVAGAVGSLVVGSVVALILARRRAPRSECEAIRRRYRRLIIDGAAVVGASTNRNLEVAAIADLARIAEHETQLIFHQKLDGACAYFVPMANGATVELLIVD